MEALRREVPALTARHPHGIVEGLLGDQQQQWQIQVWDPDKQTSTSYRVEPGGTIVLLSNNSRAHEIVAVLDLATGLGPTVVDSPQAVRKADETGGAEFTQQTHVQLWSTELTGRDRRLVWIVQYGAHVLTQRQRLTIVLDAASGQLVSQNRAD